MRTFVVPSRGATGIRDGSVGTGSPLRLVTMNPVEMGNHPHRPHAGTLRNMRPSRSTTGGRRERSGGSVLRVDRASSAEERNA